MEKRSIFHIPYSIFHIPYSIFHILIFVFFLVSCDFENLLEPSYNDPVKEYLKEYTENAAIEKVTLPSGEKNPQGILCLSSLSDKTLSFYLRNPQNYILNFDFDFNEDEIQSVAQSGGYGFIQNSDKKSGTLTLNKDFLYSVDAGNIGKKNISGFITITEPKSGRNFESYPISFHANTAPPSVQGAVFQRSSEGDDAKYIICFFMPDMSHNSMALHTKDTRIIYVNDEKKYTKQGMIYTSGKKMKTALGNYLMKIPILLQQVLLFTPFQIKHTHLILPIVQKGIAPFIM